MQQKHQQFSHINIMYSWPFSLTQSSDQPYAHSCKEFSVTDFCIKARRGVAAKTIQICKKVLALKLVFFAVFAEWETLAHPTYPSLMRKSCHCKDLCYCYIIFRRVMLQTTNFYHKKPWIKRKNTAIKVPQSCNCVIIYYSCFWV